MGFVQGDTERQRGDWKSIQVSRPQGGQLKLIILKGAI